MATFSSYYCVHFLRSIEGKKVGDELRPKIPGLYNLGRPARRNRRLAYLQGVDFESLGYDHRTKLTFSAETTG